MNSRRRAELQRKLTLNVVPRPPADLGERLKRDIPQLTPHAAPWTGSSSFTLRIAASVMVVISSVLAALYLAAPESEKQMAGAPGLPRAVPTLTLATADHATASEPAAQVRLEMPAESSLPVSLPPTVPVQVADAATTPADGFTRETTAPYAPEVAATTGSITGAARNEAVNDARNDAEERDAGVALMAESAPVHSEAMHAPTVAAPAPPAVARAASDPQARAVDSRSRAAAAQAPAYAAESHETAAASVFGISLDRQVFDRIRSAIENGSRPDPAAVDLEAVVNYFAGGADKAPARGLRLEVEASPAPVAADGDHAILRVSVDTPRSGIAKDATVEVTVDLRSVARFRRIGDDTPLRAEAVMPAGTSVTMLYELELVPRLRETQHVATVRLSWTGADGKRAATERKVTARELAGDWRRASRRHRLASLGAVWGATLKGTGGATAVARRAAELAAENPGNARARELARLSSESAP